MEVWDRLLALFWM